MNVGCSWSGGKDSCYSLMKVINEGASPKVLLNILNENGKISRSHGLTPSILQAQASAMNIPLITCKSTWENYEENYINTLLEIKSNYDLDSFVFGDIDIQSHRDWEEKVCSKANLKALLPIWQQDRRELVFEMLENGIETIITSCNLKLGVDFLGETITPDLIEKLDQEGVDVCGENGEFHTVVVNCPIFKERIDLPKYKKDIVGEYCFLNWI